MNRKTLLLVTLLVVVSLSATLVALGASNCMLKNSGFRATVSTSVYNGPPPIPFCLIGVPIVEVQVQIQGRGASGSTTQLRCGRLNGPVTLTVKGREHLIAPDSGNDWEDTLTDCDALIYKLN